MLVKLLRHSTLLYNLLARVCEKSQENFYLPTAILFILIVPFLLHTQFFKFLR